MRRVLLLLLVVPAVAAARPGDWTRFGYRADRRNVGPRTTGITAANVATLRRQQVELGGTADSSPVYLDHVLVGHRPIKRTSTAATPTSAAPRPRSLDTGSPCRAARTVSSACSASRS